jgi:tetratricopeptide (TPR) repeat protein
MKTFHPLPVFLFALIAASSSGPTYSDISREASHLQTEWAKVNYNTPEDDRADAMHALVSECDAMAAPDVSPETLIWCGIVRSTYAGLASPFSAMKYAKAARKDFETVIETDGEALSGSAYTSLGTLYFKVPGWPVGFGSDDKAEKYLLKGLSINPDGIDPNYFYGEFLYEQGEFEQSGEYLLQAQKAPARPDRPVADGGRQKEIEALLFKVGEKLNK